MCNAGSGCSVTDLHSLRIQIIVVKRYRWPSLAFSGFLPFPCCTMALGISWMSAQERRMSQILRKSARKKKVDAFADTVVLTYHDNDWTKEEALYALRRIFQLPARNILRITSARIVPTTIYLAPMEVQSLLWT